jgi:hypothetical protein
MYQNQEERLKVTSVHRWHDIISGNQILQKIVAINKLIYYIYSLQNSHKRELGSLH